MKKIAVIGAGLMGHGLALDFALGGYQVGLNDLTDDVLATARRLIEGHLETLAEAGLVDAEERRAVLDERITFTTDKAVAAADAGFVVEAVFEDPAVKKEVFAELDRLAPADAILASNTSYLNVFDIVETIRPDRFLIAHWYSPVHIVPVVDVVPGPATASEAVAAVVGLLEDMGKQPIVMNKFVPGYVSARVQAAMALEIYHLLDEGYATPEVIDAALKGTIGLRLPIQGHLGKTDFAGLDYVRRSLRNKAYTPPQVRGFCRHVDDLVAQGHTGPMSGRGFFDYGGKSPRELFRERDLNILKLKALLKEMGALA
jgi:3-hydroxybutyryl-CoA dehydrogenase